ncbi:MAG: TonB-dependent receptor plug domain-containing protein, partial [Bacteroidota bacterium]
SGPTATVRAKRIRAGELATQRLTQLDIYLDPAAKADPLLAVNNLASSTNLDETANVSLRGSPSAATGVYLDGVPIRSAVRIDQSNGLGQFSIFGQFSLEEVRVYPGHPPISLGRSSAGAVQLRTLATPLQEASYGISLNLAGLGFSFARPLGTKTDLRTFVNFGQTQAFQALNDQTFSDLRGSAALDGAIAITHRISDQSRVSAYLLAFEENYRFLTRTSYLTDEFQQEKSRQLGVLSWQMDGEKWSWRASQMVDWDRNEFILGNIETRPDRLNMYTEFSGRQEGRGYSREFGIQFDRFYDQVSGTFPLNDYEFAAGDPSDSYTFAGSQSTLTAYAAVEQRLGDNFTLEAGTRLARHFQSNDYRWSAQGSLHFKPSPRNRLILGGGHYQQLLSPGAEIDEWQWLQLNQLSLSYQFRRDLWSANVAVYRKWEDYQFITDQNITGVEARIGYRTEGLRMWASGSMVRVRSRAGNIPSGRDLPFLLRGQIVRASRNSYSFGLTATWREGRYFLPLLRSEAIPEQEGLFRPIFVAPDSGSRLPQYVRLDFSISRIFSLGRGQLIIYANVNNLLNTQNVSRYIYPNGTDPRKSELYSGRIIFLGGVWTFSGPSRAE